MLNLDDLTFFSTIIDAGSLTKAAKLMDVPKSKLSRRLANLESELGYQLLIRTTRKQELTASGLLLYRSCKPHLEALSGIENDIHELNTSPKGRLNILLPSEFFSQVISQIITDFAKIYPDIVVHCSHYSSKLPEENYYYDLIFILHETDLPSSSWVGKQLLSFPQSIYAGVDYSTDHLHTPEDIQNEKCITSNNNEQWLFREHNKIQLISVNEKVILSSPQMRLEATSQHLGIAKLPDYLCQSGGHLLNVKRIKLSNEPVALQLTVLYQSRSIAFKTRMFLEYFQSNIGSLS
ncbi:LysR family transcriptional regulator [Pseudocolwellia sp. AS88]|uniref:LysR family transcriptional regulator n=1 Tax=Pseudocolwellia sp. AS88 TaxID=3063958 RepID=UPI0026F1E58D|nr:LysR family transcriptional regulator [Pseudocolwellia sp. AS88]MDO7085479.1 LysR family transcriptional regulator [Pseudocolwellia sp. AS88]